jgi:hypothetical protein
VNKRCCHCRTEKPLSEFGKDKSRPDKLNQRCRSCANEAFRAWCDNNRDRRREVSRDSRKRNYDKARYGLATERYAAKHPERVLAVKAKNHAIEYGRMERAACAVCGTNKWVHAHHPDYSKPLEVVWLCAAHHKEVHRKENANESRTRMA